MENFAVTDVSYTDQPSYVTMALTTNNPCNLAAYISEVAPLRHPAYRTIRGLQVKWGAYFCFVAWKIVYQQEPGDSLTHTFLIPDWFPCQWRYIICKGTVIGIDSPSIGPVFAHHNSYQAPQSVILRPNSPGDLCQIPYQIANPCPNHYLQVDDVIPDEDASKIWTHAPFSNVWKYDLYNISSFPVASIDHFTFSVRGKRTGGYAYSPTYRILFKTNGSLFYYQPPTTPATWNTINYSSFLNPVTGLPWTQLEFDTLQIGVAVYRWVGVGISSFGSCTQAYATIYHL